MTRKCVGCGAILQTTNREAIGYIKNDTDIFCERCFRIKHYSDYKVVDKDNDAYYKIIDNINKSNDLVLFVVDLFNIDSSIYELASKIKNPCLLVLTKRDLFAKDIYNQKFIEYLRAINLNLVDIVLVSSKNKEGFDDLYNKIYKYKTSDNVYVVGLTNAGKSTMLNTLLKHYFDKEDVITTSMLPSTTIDTINIKASDDLTFIDTPGILGKSITNLVDSKMLKKITPKKVIKPITYQIKVDQSIVIDEIIRIDISAKNDITLFFANQLNIMRYYKDNNRLKKLHKYEIDVPNNSDIVISGLGFIKVKKAAAIIIYTLANVDISTRTSLI